MDLDKQELRVKVKVTKREDLRQNSRTQAQSFIR